MDPFSGKLYSESDYAELLKTDPDHAARLVHIEGQAEDVERISHAVQALNRAERRAAERAGRRKGR